MFRKLLCLVGIHTNRYLHIDRLEYGCNHIDLEIHTKCTYCEKVLNRDGWSYPKTPMKA